MVNAIFATGDNLVQTTEVNHNREVQRTMFFVRDIALKLDQSDRLNLLSEAIQNGNSPYLASRFIELLLREHGEYDADPSPEADRLLDMKDIDELKSVVVETVSDAAATGDLIDVPWLKRPLEQRRKGRVPETRALDGRHDDGREPRVSRQWVLQRGFGACAR
jgi:hypothetical protein